MTKQSYLNDNKEIVQKYTNAIYKAQRWVQSHTAEETATTITPFFKDTDHDILVSSVKRYLEQGTYAENPVLDDSEWNNLLDVIDTAGELKSSVERAQIVDDTFAEAAIKAGK
ncbi:hypothetical protein D3C78_1458400 [compost metagenome]